MYGLIKNVTHEEIVKIQNNEFMSLKLNPEQITELKISNK